MDMLFCTAFTIQTRVLAACLLFSKQHICLCIAQDMSHVRHWDLQGDCRHMSPPEIQHPVLVALQQQVFRLSAWENKKFLVAMYLGPNQILKEGPSPQHVCPQYSSVSVIQTKVCCKQTAKVYMIVCCSRKDAWRTPVSSIQPYKSWFVLLVSTFMFMLIMVFNNAEHISLGHSFDVWEDAISRWSTTPCDEIPHGIKQSSTGISIAESRPLLVREQLFSCWGRHSSLFLAPRSYHHNTVVAKCQKTPVLGDSRK